MDDIDTLALGRPARSGTKPQRTFCNYCRKGADVPKPTFNTVADEHHDEVPNEFRLGRRAALMGLAGGTVASVAGLVTPAAAQQSLRAAAEIGKTLENIPNMCRVTTATIEGPYYIDQRIIRSDIREKQPGVPLELELQVVNASGGCRPISGALVSIWHCNADGEYSGYLFNDPNQMPDPSAADATGHVPQQDKERWLRGAQVADANGKVTFKTIVPGWYQLGAVTSENW